MARHASGKRLGGTAKSFPTCEAGKDLSPQTVHCILTCELFVYQLSATCIYHPAAKPSTMEGFLKKAAQEASPEQRTIPHRLCMPYSA